MRSRINKLARSTQNAVNWQQCTEPHAPKEQREALALNGTRAPEPRLPSPIEMARLSDLKPPRRNARTHSKKQFQQIANSILRFGWTYPILTDENKRIIAGFGRFKAAEQLGIRDVPVIIMTGLNDAEKRALALADNKIAANAGWDRAVLAAELGELADLLPECHLNIEITGFEPAEIDTLMVELVDSEQDPADEFPQISKEPVSRKGDL